MRLMQPKTYIDSFYSLNTYICLQAKHPGLYGQGSPAKGRYSHVRIARRTQVILGRGGPTVHRGPMADRHALAGSGQFAEVLPLSLRPASLSAA